MKYLLTITILYLVLSISQTWGLPTCKNSNLDNCYGTFTWPDGYKYIGEWKERKMHGQGTFFWPNGNKYVGQFRNGTQNGQGTFYYHNGDKYVGEFKDGKENGQGTFTYLNGNKYVGEFKNDEFHGQGTLTNANGLQSIGEWKNGICVNCVKIKSADARKADREAKRKRELKETEAKIKKLNEEKLKAQRDAKLQKEREAKLKREKKEREAKLKKEKELRDIKNKEIAYWNKDSKYETKMLLLDLESFIKTNPKYFDAITIIKLIKPVRDTIAKNTPINEKSLAHIKNLVQFTEDKKGFSIFRENKIEKRKEEIRLALERKERQRKIKLEKQRREREFILSFVKLDTKIKTDWMLNFIENNTLHDKAHALLTLYEQYVNKLNKDANNLSYKDIEFIEKEIKKLNLFYEYENYIKLNADSEYTNNKARFYVIVNKDTVERKKEVKIDSNQEKVNIKSNSSKRKNIITDKSTEAYWMQLEGLYGKQQRYLHKVAYDAVQEVNLSKNDAAIKYIWIKANNTLCNNREFDAFSYKENWVGTIYGIESDNQGNLTFQITITAPLHTNNNPSGGGLTELFKNALKDVFTNNSVRVRIKKLKRSLNSKVINLEKSDIVRFSGYFVEGNRSQNECFKSASYWVEGPDLINTSLLFNITDIEKY